MQIHNPATNYCTFIPDHTARYPRRHVRRYHVISGNVISKVRPLLRRFSRKSQKRSRAFCADFLLHKTP